MAGTSVEALHKQRIAGCCGAASSVYALVLVCLTIFVGACGATGDRDDGRVAPVDWRTEWAVDRGFAITIDTEGFELPSSIAFVPDPGSDPKDPLYFVTELRGKIKVVTNDRSVYTFAEDFFSFVPREELPSGQGQAGLAGICLDPVRGYVFATYAYQDERGVLRNNIIRFETTPKTFSLKPTDSRSFAEIFIAHESGLAHQIGNCEVAGDYLYVGIGEGWQPFRTQQLDQMQGKLLRMTLDGEPLSDNPYFKDDDRTKVRNYVWAYGLRNPFGLSLIDGEVFVVDNGLAIDRFIKIREGVNYLWDGSDRSTAANADYIWDPAIGPVQMDFSGRSSFLPEAYQNAFFVALSGSRSPVQPLNTGPGIMVLRYGFREDAIVDVPSYFVEYKGQSHQMVTGLAFGPDGLYFAPLHPVAEGLSPILKVVPDSAGTYPAYRGGDMEPAELVQAKGCTGCHTLEGKLGYAGGTAAPPLMRGIEFVNRYRAKLESDAYEASLNAVDELTTEPHVSYRAARQEVLGAKGVEKVRIWLKYYVQEPRFDRQYNRMPAVGLSEQEAEVLADFFIAGADRSFAGMAGFHPAVVKERVMRLLRRALPAWMGPKLLIFFVGGLVAGMSISSLAAWLLFRRRRAQTA